MPDIWASKSLVPTVHLVWEGEGEGEVREKVEGQEYTSIYFLHPWGQQFTRWVENINHE
jgi:hypothetical protein